MPAKAGRFDDAVRANARVVIATGAGIAARRIKGGAERILGELQRPQTVACLHAVVAHTRRRIAAGAQDRAGERGLERGEVFQVAVVVFVEVGGRAFRRQVARAGEAAREENVIIQIPSML